MRSSIMTPSRPPLKTLMCIIIPSAVSSFYNQLSFRATVLPRNAKLDRSGNIDSGADFSWSDNGADFMDMLDDEVDDLEELEAWTSELDDGKLDTLVRDWLASSISTADDGQPLAPEELEQQQQELLEALDMAKPSAKVTVALEKEAAATAARSAAATAGAKAKDLAAKAAEAAAVSAAAAAAAEGVNSNPINIDQLDSIGAATPATPLSTETDPRSRSSQRKSSSGGKGTSPSSKRSAASVDDAYAVAMGAGGEDAAESAQWMDAAREQKLPTVGIDLGTTNSLCAVWLKGRPTLVPNEEGSHLTPSVVSFLSDGDYGDGAIAMDALRSDNRGAWVVVGEKAKRHALSNPANTFACAKRILGRPTTSTSSSASSHQAAELQEVASRYVDNELVEFGAGGNAAELRRLGNQVMAEVLPSGEFLLTVPALFDAKLSPVDISAEVVRQLLGDSAQLFGGHTPPRAVVGVPARFNKYQREATITACMLAGLQEVHLITEPEAAALAFGLGRRNTGKSKEAMAAAEADQSKVERTLVVDLGGGTFDVSVVDVSAAQVETVAIGGDPRLGGGDFDDRLAAYLAEIFYDTTGLLVGPGTGNMNSLMPSNNHDYGGFGGYRGSSSSARSRSSSGPNGRNGASGSSSGQGDEVSAWWRLLDAAEECRLALSDNLNATVYLPELVDYCPLGPVVITRREFEKAMLPLIERMEQAIVGTLEEAVRQDAKRGTALEAQRLNNVVLVGGAVRMPFIGRLVKASTGVTPRRTVNPDEAIALGCAVQAASLDGLVGDLRLVAAAPSRRVPPSPSSPTTAGGNAAMNPTEEKPLKASRGRPVSPPGPKAAKLPTATSNRETLIKRALKEAEGV